MGSTDHDPVTRSEPFGDGERERPRPTGLWPRALTAPRRRPGAAATASGNGSPPVQHPADPLAVRGARPLPPSPSTSCRPAPHMRTRCAAPASCASASATAATTSRIGRDRSPARVPEPAAARRGTPATVRGRDGGDPRGRRRARPARRAHPAPAACNAHALALSQLLRRPSWSSPPRTRRRRTRPTKRGRRATSSRAPPRMSRPPSERRNDSSPGISRTPTVSGRAGRIAAASDALRRRLAARPPRVPARERHRRPHVVLVQSNGVGRGRAELVALIRDGTRRYTVPLELTRGRAGWTVTAVGS